MTRRRVDLGDGGTAVEVGPGPTPGTVWAIPEQASATAGVVVTAGTPGEALTRAEQAARQHRAQLLLARGVVLTAADTPDPQSPEGLRWRVRVWRFHTPGCPHAGVPAEHVGDRPPQRAALAQDALAGRPPTVPRGSLHPTRRDAATDASWCPTCLGEDTP